MSDGLYAWHSSWTTEMKRDYLVKRVEDEGRLACVYAADREWVEAEECLKAIRRALEELEARVGRLEETR